MFFVSTEENLKALILSKYGTVKDFAAAVRLPYTTVDTIIRRGITKASVNNIILICQKLGISADELAKGKLTPLKEIQTEFKDLMRHWECETANLDYTLNGVTMTRDELDVIINAAKVAVSIIEERRDANA